MKKIILSLLVLILLTGCVSVKNTSLDKIIDTTINSKYSLYNHVNKGFKYYLPRELKVTLSDEYNEIIKSKYHDYYLYVDLVRYFNKKEEKFTETDNIYFSRVLKSKDHSGVINIYTNDEEEYLIKVNYNYATIEVKVLEKDINEAVTNILVILSSIQYNEGVIKNLLQDDKISSMEEQIDVFKDDLTDTDYLDVEEEIYDDEEYDPDMIN